MELPQQQCLLHVPAAATGPANITEPLAAVMTVTAILSATALAFTEVHLTIGPKSTAVGT
ncbi:hypothetical protein GCM10011576_24540 [Micromonospora parathelypteridis]|nr:hypothetical protein GCM10011576_24540 [Micromonospora parathelypteridis]